MFKIFVFCSIIFAGTQAQAQSIDDYVTVAPPESWVKVQQTPIEAFALSADQKLSYKLLSYQTLVSKSDRRSYRRTVLDLQNASAVEDNGTISIDFDPSYKKIKFHHIRVINSDGTRNVLDLNDGELFRTETDRDKLLFDGTLQFSFAIQGLKIGDRIDYAYTSYGKNPAYGEGYFVRNWQAYTTPTQSLYQRVSIDGDMPVFTKLHRDAAAPIRTTEGGKTIFTTSLRDVKGMKSDENRPAWHYGFPAVELSSYGDWSGVGNHFAPFYRTPEKNDPQIQKIINEIEAGTSDTKEQARRALNYVQENIRYLGLEMGVGGFQPRPPSLVYDRRFGDCKDVTLFLLTLLNGLGIDADPVLVHSRERAGFLNGQPNHWGFDHVVVRAHIDGTGYVLDATRGKQLGTLDKLDQGNFQKGLILREGGSEVIDLPETQYEWREDFYDEFDLASDKSDILYTLTARYYGENADTNYEWYRNDGLSKIETVFFDYFADFYPSIQIEKPTEIEIDEENASLTIKAYYRIVDGWDLDEESNQKSFWAIPYELRASFPVFSGAGRTSPYAIPYPAKHRQILAFKVGDNYAFDDADLPYETDAFAYREANQFEGRLYEEIYTYETKQDFIAADDAAEVLGFVNETRDDFGLYITDYISPDRWDSMTDKDWEQLFTFSFFLVAILAALIAAGFAQNRDLEWRDELIFHPMPMSKFLILSFITIGHFQIYWIYKNWQWVKTVQKEDIWPIPRAFFASIMNFALFQRIAEQGDPENRYSWFPILSIPLALLFFAAAMLDRAIMRIPSLPEWLTILSLFSVLILVPVLMQVNRYNMGKPEVVAKNGTYSWTSWLLIAAYAPLAIMVWIGCAMILFENT